MDFDLRSTQWFHEFQIQADKDEAKLAMASMALDDMDEKMTECKRVIRTEEERLSKFQEEVKTLQTKFANAKRDHRCNKAMVPYMSTYLCYLEKILKEKNGQNYTTNGHIQRIVKQTESAVNVTFNSLQQYFGALSRKTEGWYESRLTPDQILKEKLLFVMELPFIIQPSPHPQVKQATDFLKRFLSDNQKQMIKILIRENGVANLGIAGGAGGVIMGHHQRDSISSSEEDETNRFQECQSTKRICTRSREWTPALIIKLESDG